MEEADFQCSVCIRKFFSEKSVIILFLVIVWLIDGIKFKTPF